MRLNKPRNISLILKITKNYVQNGEKFNNYYLSKRNNFFLNQLPLIYSSRDTQALTIYEDNKELKTIRKNKKISKRLPSLCPFYNSKGEILSNVIESSRINKTNNFCLKQSFSVENFAYKRIIKNNMKNKLKEIDLSMKKFKNDFFLLEEEKYKNLVYDESEIFNVGDKWEKFIKAQIDLLQNEKNQNLIYEKQKYFYIGKNKENKIDLKLNSLKIIFEKIKQNEEGTSINRNDKITEFNLPFALLPLFYYKGIKTFLIILQKIISISKEGVITINEDEIYSLINNTNLFSFFEEINSEQNSTPSEVVNSYLNLPIIHSKSSYIYQNLNEKKNSINHYNEYSFPWSKESLLFNVKIILPKLSFSFFSTRLLVNKYVEMEMMMYLITNKFLFWDFYLINYLFSFKTFRNIIKQIFSVNSHKLYERVINMTDIKIFSPSKYNNKIEAMYTQKNDKNYFNIINCTRIKLVKRKNEKEIEEYIIQLNFSQMSKICEMKKHNKNNNNFIYNFISLNKENGKIEFNYSLLDSFDVKKWIKEYYQYNKNEEQSTSLNGNDSEIINENEINSSQNEIQLEIIECNLDIYEIQNKTNIITKIRTIELDQSIQNKIIDNEDNIDNWIYDVLKKTYGQKLITNINFLENPGNNSIKNSSSQSIYSIKKKNNSRKSSSKMIYQSPYVTKFSTYK